jgi:hypothetical protein
MDKLSKKQKAFYAWIDFCRKKIPWIEKKRTFKNQA